MYKEFIALNKSIQWPAGNSIVLLQIQLPPRHLHQLTKTSKNISFNTNRNVKVDVKSLQKTFCKGRGGGLVVSMISLYSNDPSSKATEACRFWSVKYCLKNRGWGLHTFMYKMTSNLGPSNQTIFFTKIKPQRMMISATSWLD